MLLFSRKAFVSLAILPVFCLEGCVTTVPPLQTPLDSPVMAAPNVYVTEVVQRVKCELYLAVSPYLGSALITKKDGAHFKEKAAYYWLSKFGATAHLELVLNNQGSLTPGVTITSILPNAYSATAGASSMMLGAAPSATPTLAAINQSFNFGLGGGVSSQAVRTDDVQFSVSMKELFDQFALNRSKTAAYYHNCQDGEQSLGGTDYLDAQLGLQEWVKSALGPTDCFAPPSNEQRIGETIIPPQGAACVQYLALGKHPSVPNGAGILKQVSVPVPAKPGAASPLLGFTPEDQANEIKNELDALATAIVALKQNSAALSQIKCLGEDKTTFKNSTDQALSAFDDAKRENENYDKNPSNLGELQKAYNTARNLASAASLLLPDIQSKLASTACKPPAQLDAPVDNLTHTVQFVVAYNLNATPSWSFARIKTANSTALASITHNNTQTLSVVLGPPSENGHTAENENLKAVLRSVFTPSPF